MPSITKNRFAQTEVRDHVERTLGGQRIKVVDEWERINILYGDVLSIYGVPQDFELLRLYGSKVFDKRTRLYKNATAIRRQQLIEQYGIEAQPSKREAA